MILNHAPLQGSVALLVCLVGAVSLQNHSVLADHALVLCDFDRGQGDNRLPLQVRAVQGSPCVVVLLSVVDPAVLSSATAKQVGQWSRVASEIEGARKHHHELLRARKPCGCIDVAASAAHDVICPAAGAAGASSAARGQPDEGNDTSCPVEQQSQEGGVTRDASPTRTSPGASPNSGCLQAAPRTSTHCTPALQFSYRLA